VEKIAIWLLVSRNLGKRDLNDDGLSREWIDLGVTTHFLKGAYDDGPFAANKIQNKL
jgi:hypothetical protein